jgi:hypothetical protein
MLSNLHSSKIVRTFRTKYVFLVIYKKKLVGVHQKFEYETNLMHVDLLAQLTNKVLMGIFH